MNKRTKEIAAIMLVLVIFFMAITVVFAQEGGAEASEQGTKSVFTLFKNTGFVGILLLIASVSGLALTIQYTVNIKEEKLVPQPLVAQIEELLAAQDIEGAHQVCQSNNNYFCNIVGGGLERAFGGYDEIRAGLAETSTIETFKLNAKISYLSLIGNLGPLIGLLGTVTGMISSFQAIEHKKNPTPADLAKGVYESLVNTTMGLFVAIIFLTINFYFKNKISDLTLRINTIATDIFAKTISPEAMKAMDEQPQ
jgi:biopolymer transport protein ExbB